MDKELEKIIDDASVDFKNEFNLLWTSTNCWDRTTESAIERDNEIRNLYKREFKFHIKTLFRKYTKEELEKLLKAIINDGNN